MKRYTAAELAFVKRRRKMPRRDLLLAFKRKFRRRDFTLLRLQDLCSRNGWGVGSLKGRTKGISRVYSKVELAFVKRRHKMPRRNLHAAFVETFGRADISLKALNQLCKRNRWSNDHAGSRAKKGQTKFSNAELRFVRCRSETPRRQLHAAFVEKFPREISLDGFKALCDRLGLRTGRTGRFDKGVFPANKGKKMPFNANSARTRFKKGHRTGHANQVYKPIGSTRFSKEGYLERKIHDGLPLQSRWRGVHRINWEKKHGAVPTGHVLKCLDGNKLNTAPSNWEVISRAVLARRNKRFAGATLPPELELTAIAIAKLDVRVGEKRRGKSA